MDVAISTVLEKVYRSVKIPGIQISQNSVGRKSGGFIQNHDFGQHCKTRHQGLTHGSSGSSQGTLRAETRNVIHVYVRICMYMYNYISNYI